MNVCMLAYSTYPADVRIKREAEALVNKGYKVDIICLRGKKEIACESVNGVAIYRVPLNKKRGGVSTYLYSYSAFIIIAAIKLWGLFIEKKYSFIHLHNPPDYLILPALPLKFINGTKLILDIHDPMPEIFASRFELSTESISFRLMQSLEWFCCKISDKTITVNQTIKDNLINMGINDIYVVMNSADETLFTEEKKKTSKEKFGLSDRFVVLYEGSIMKRRGLDILIDSIVMAKEKIPNIYCAIIGDGDYLPHLRQRVNKLGLENIIGLPGRRPVEEMPEYVAISDVCVIPFTKSPINQIGVPNKLFEYLVYGKPTIVPKLLAMSRILSEEECLFFEPEDANSLSDRILEVYNNPERIKDLARNSREIFEKYSWEIMKERLYECYS